MRKNTWFYLFLLIFFWSCSKGKYNGSIILSWENKENRKEDCEVIEQRLKKLGIKNFKINIVSEHAIEIDLKNVRDTSRLINLMMYNESIYFWECYENPEAFSFLDDLDKRLAGEEVFPDTTIFYGIQKDSALKAENKLMHPLWSHLYASIRMENNNNYLEEGAVVGRSFVKDTAFVDSLLRIGSRLCFPHDMILQWTLFPEQDSICTLVALKKFQGTGGAFMDQTMIKDSEMDENDFGEFVTVEFDENGTKLWEKITKKNTGRCIAITLGNKVISYPRVESTITGGKASITGRNREELKVIQQGSKMIPFKTKPSEIRHHFEKNK
jgi:SecD/SecF fusion protein